jgi:cytochrome c oxidase accessory protein FixG
MSSLSLLGPKRAAVRWLTSLAVLLLPFIQPGGVSLLRLDLPARTLFFFGGRLRLEEFFLLLLATLLLVFAFILLTLLFGRVWCGWLCPQTTLVDLAEFLERRLAGLRGGKVLLQLLLLIVSVVVGANLVWYFLTPQEFFARLASGNLGAVAGYTLAITATATWLNVVFVRRTLCTSVCPYGRVQLLLTDNNTLTLEFDPQEGSRCIRCGACVRACPTGIDIREGLQVECINCGRCLDACRQVMAKRHEPGIIHYTFGRTAEGSGRPLNAKTVAIGFLVLLLAGALAVSLARRQEVTLVLQQNPLAAPRPLDGGSANFLTANLENRSPEPRTVTLAVVAPAGYTARLVGPVRGIYLAPNENRRVDFLLQLTPPPAAPVPIRFGLAGMSSSPDAGVIFQPL